MIRRNRSWYVQDSKLGYLIHHPSWETRLCRAFVIQLAVWVDYLTQTLGDGVLSLSLTNQRVPSPPGIGSQKGAVNSHEGSL